MIYFTGGGALYDEFARHFDCEKISIRKQGISALVELVKAEDIVVHNSALVCPKNLSEAMESNFQLTKELANALLVKSKNIKLIFLSSMSILVNASEYQEESKLGPYALSKFKAEKFCLNLKLKVCSVRFSTLFYKDPLKDGLSNLIYTAVRNKEITLINGGVDKRDFLPLEIAVKYLYRICTQESDLNIHTIASGNAFSFKEVAEIIQDFIPSLKILDKSVEIKSNPVLSRFTKESNNLLGEIQFSIQEHIGNYIKELGENNHF